MKPALKSPSFTAHFIVVLMLLSSIIVPLILLVQFFKGGDNVEKTWDGLARWVEDALED